MKYRVLLVDDEILVRDAIREHIDWEGLGYELVGDCQNGKEAMEFVQEQPVDVVLTDICMPYVDGMELSHFLHDNYPETLIVVFSGFGEFEYAKKAIQYKVSEYLLKPVTALELSEVLIRMKKKLENARREEMKIQRLTKTSEEYKKNQQMIRSRAISSLVIGSRGTEESLRELEAIGIHLEAADYRVAVLGIDLYSGMYEQSAVQRQESALMAFVVYNISDEIVRNYDAGIVYQETNSRVCILFRTNRPKEFSRTVKKICEEIQQKIYENMKMEISISVGPYVKKTADLHYSYDRANEALDYRYLLGGNLILDLENDGGFDREVSLHAELEELAEAIRKNRQEELETILETIRKKIVGSRSNSSRACLYLQQILRTISGVIEKVHPDPKQVNEKRNQLLMDIFGKKTFAEAMEIAASYAREAGEYMEAENSSSGRRQAMQAMEYIQENYQDPDMGLNSICVYLGISTSHFSAVFKEMTGETFMEALTRIRMEKAKELLENTTLKNYEIAERVGFSDPHYFGIAFKKITGRTPTVYAKEKRQ